jgi:peptidoglycan/LPS O-acetylase OafA/YrhL
VKFWGARLWRLFPTFWAVNIISVVVFSITQAWPNTTPVGADWIHRAASNVLILGYGSFQPSQVLLPHAWSLDMEVQFYLLAPLIFLLARRTVGAWLLLAGSVAGGTLYAFAPLESPHRVSSYAVFFLIGVVSAQRGWRPSNKAAAVLAAGLGMVVVALWISPFRFVIQNAQHGATAEQLEIRRFSIWLLALAASPLPIWSVVQPSPRLDRRIGDFTYALYLAHWPVMFAHYKLFAGLPPLQRLPSILAAWLIAGALSFGVYRLIDGPANRARKRFFTGQKAPPSGQQRTSDVGPVAVEENGRALDAVSATEAETR